ncbi:MAG: hypothetical protein D3914_08660, partial [Candidatus Electrothrix sp. LOE2]|nr:hypothetical protein [Candidatus Electrothrix sp. LOE2]
VCLLQVAEYSSAVEHNALFLHDQCQQYIPLFPEVQPALLGRECVGERGGVVCGFILNEKLGAVAREVGALTR